MHCALVVYRHSRALAGTGGFGRTISIARCRMGQAFSVVKSERSAMLPRSHCIFGGSLRVWASHMKDRRGSARRHSR